MAETHERLRGIFSDWVIDRTRLLDDGRWHFQVGNRKIMVQVEAKARCLEDILPNAESAVRRFLATGKIIPERSWD